VNAKAAGAFYKVDPESLVSRETLLAPVPELVPAAAPAGDLAGELALIRTALGTLASRVAEMQQNLEPREETEASPSLPQRVK
jgi:hypothetical protein